MTDKKRYEQLSAIVLFFLVSCSHPQQVAATQPSVPATIASEKAANGTMQVIVFDVPSDLAKTDLFQGNFEGQSVPIFSASDLGEKKYEAVFGIPFDHKPGNTSFHYQIGTVSNDVPFEVVEGNYPSETLKVDPRKVNPLKKDMPRIKDEQETIGKIYSRLTPKKYWSGPFVLPIQSEVRSVFGSRRLYNGEPRSFHPGMDLRAQEGTPIHAPAPGEVVMAKNLFFTGNTVAIDHGYGLISLYAHMSKIDAKVGDIVKTGDVLGLSGKTGRVTGPHFHRQIVVQKQKVNPLDLTKILK